MRLKRDSIFADRSHTKLRLRFENVSAQATFCPEEFVSPNTYLCISVSAPAPWPSSHPFIFPFAFPSSIPSISICTSHCQRKVRARTFLMMMILYLHGKQQRTSCNKDHRYLESFEPFVLKRFSPLLKSNGRHYYGVSHVDTFRSTYFRSPTVDTCGWQCEIPSHEGGGMKRRCQRFQGT